MLDKLLSLFKSKSDYLNKHQDYWTAYEKAEKEREEILDKLIEVRTLISKSNTKLASYILKAQEDMEELESRKDADGILIYNLTKAFRDAALEHININNKLIAKMIDLKK